MKRAILLIVIVGVLGAVFFGRLTDAAHHPDRDRAASAHQVVTARENRAIITAVTAPLLHLRYSDLEPREDRGDEASACKRTWEINLCANAEKLADEEAHWIEIAANAQYGTRQYNDAVARSSAIADKIERASVACRSLSSRHYQSLGKWLVDAARMGNADAMAFIILEPGGYGLSEEDLRETSAANALKWLNRSADAGNPYAMKALSHAYAHGYFFTREGRLEIEKDFRKSAAIAEVLQRHGDQRTATQMNDLLGYLKSKINPDDQKHVKKLAAIYEMNLARHDAFDMSSPYGIFFPENPCQD